MKRQPGRDSMQEFVREQTVTRLKILSQQLTRASQKPHREAVIHDVRVAIRRFLQCLKIFEPFFEAGSLKKIRKPLIRLLRACGEVRNCDIALALLQEVDLRDTPLFNRLQRRRKRYEEELAKRLVRWKRGSRMKQWARRLNTEVEIPKTIWRPTSGVAVNARLVLPRMAREFFQAGKHAAKARAAYARMHQFRLLAKRLRYTLEVFTPVYSQEMSGALTALSGLQDRLGVINDCVASKRLMKGERSAIRAIGRLLPLRKQAFQEFWTHEFSGKTAAAWNAWLKTPQKRNIGQ